MTSLTIEEVFIPGKMCQNPAILIHPPSPKGAALITHGYGGNKEELLGLGFRVAGTGLTACVMDLRGHGDHPQPLDPGVKDDIEAIIQYLRSYGKIVMIGHSVGGRLALLSSADYQIALSPPLRETFTRETQERLKLIRSYRVHPPDTSVLFDLLKQTPIPDPMQYTGKKTLILFGERDMPEIISDGNTLMQTGESVFCIPGAFHNDIYLVEQALECISSHIRNWFPGTNGET